MTSSGRETKAPSQTIRTTAANTNSRRDSRRVTTPRHVHTAPAARRTNCVTQRDTKFTRAEMPVHGIRDRNGTKVHLPSCGTDMYVSQSTRNCPACTAPRAMTLLVRNSIVCAPVRFSIIGNCCSLWNMRPSSFINDASINSEFERMIFSRRREIVRSASKQTKKKKKTKNCAE